MKLFPHKLGLLSGVLLPLVLLLILTGPEIHPQGVGARQPYRRAHTPYSVHTIAIPTPTRLVVVYGMCYYPLGQIPPEGLTI